MHLSRTLHRLVSPNGRVVLLVQAPGPGQVASGGSTEVGSDACLCTARTAVVLRSSAWAILWRHDLIVVRHRYSSVHLIRQE